MACSAVLQDCCRAGFLRPQRPGAEPLATDSFHFKRTTVAGQSRCSKAGSLEVRDLSEAEALEFLRLRDIPGKAAAQVVDVAGGRLLELLAATEVLQQGGTAQGDQDSPCLFVSARKLESMS